MIAISQISETLEQVAQAIVSVIDVDVLIVDRQLVRLVGTGRLARNLQTPVDQGSVFAYALKRGESFVIEDPRTHEACRNCGQKGVCAEQAELCCPIRINGEVAGVIGLIAFDSQSRSRLLDRKDSYLDFVRQMADLIASKALEIHRLRETEKLAGELHTLVEELSQGVLITDDQGRVIHSNGTGRDLLGVSEAGSLTAVLPRICTHKSGLRPGRHTFISPGGTGRILCTIKAISTADRTTGYVVIAEMLKDVMKTVSHVMGAGAGVDFSHIIGQSALLRSSIDLGRRASAGDNTVLILGESGTGKELFARAIHTASSRSREPFVPINCAAIPDHLLESELFGYEEGAFTGARKGGVIGKFEMADRGTLFLDEIGDMSLHLQTKLLRVLEERVLDKLGSRKRIPVDVRIIAATHQDLEAQIREGRFRQDLFFRLNVIPLQLPPLRQRREDILPLARHFIGEICENRRIASLQLDTGAAAILESYGWPGNVRELQNALAYALQMASGDSVTAENLPERLRMATEPGAGSEPAVRGLKPLAVLEREAIQAAMSLFKGDAAQAAKALGIGRATLYRRLKGIKEGNEDS